MQEQGPTRDEQLAAVARTVGDADFKAAAQALRSGRVELAERGIAAFLARDPGDAAALRLHAAIAARRGAKLEAAASLRRAIAAAPDVPPLRVDLVRLLEGSAEALAHADHLLESEPGRPLYVELKSWLLGKVGREEEALALLDRLASDFSREPRFHLQRASWLRTLGRTGEAVAALRRVLELDPHSGAAWWGLANLKTVRLAEGDLGTMEAALADPRLPFGNLPLIHFALGKASEDRARFEPAFRHYSEANRLQRTQGGQDFDGYRDVVRRSRQVFTFALRSRLEGRGAASPDPIFIVGMHRSGSTLLEQILATHSAIEGTDELRHVGEIADIVRQMSGRPCYVDGLESIDPGEYAGLGDEYLRRAAIHRRSGKPRFIDKMPGNWLHLGLVHLMLPNARIIDMRRHPLDCCFSNFTQYYATGAGGRDLDQLGLYYRDYVSLLRHFDEVLPGRIHRIHYERLVDDPEGELRRLFAFLDLDFEPACLRFHENRRPVRTPSSEQVRRPITRSPGRAAPFTAWLGPLKQALGPVLDEYPEVPGEDGIEPPAPPD